MPADGFAFAVRVGRENELFSALGGLCDVTDPGGRLGISLPDHGKIIVWID